MTKCGIYTETLICLLNRNNELMCELHMRNAIAYKDCILFVLFIAVSVDYKASQYLATARRTN